LSAELYIAKQLMRKITELAKARVSDKALKESIMEEIDRKFSDFIKYSMEGVKE